MKNVEKEVILNSFVKERIKENEKLFTVEELEYIKHNRNCINKIYLLGCVNSIESYKNNKISN